MCDEDMLNEYDDLLMEADVPKNLQQSWKALKKVIPSNDKTKKAIKDFETVLNYFCEL